MSTINASIVDQVLTITNAPLIASGDINVDHVQFEFDQTWDDFGLMAVFWRDGDVASYRSVIGPTGLALVPHEVLTEEGRICFGVVGVAGDQTKTSSVGFYDIKQGALTTGSETDPPTPGEYEQMLTAVGEARAAFAAAVAQMEMAAGRVEIYDGLASDLSAVSRSGGTFRRVPFPTGMKIVDFDRMTIQLTNAGRPDLSSGQTGDLAVVTGDYIVLASFSAGNEGGIVMLELSGLSGTPDDNAFQLTIANRYKTGVGSYASEESIAIQNWGVTGILTNVNYFDLHVTGDTYVRVVGYCNEVAAEAPSGAYVKPAGGIPKSDLADAVKASLGLADGSVQKNVQTAKTDDMTQPVGMGDDGKFYTTPGGSGGNTKPAGGWGTNDIANGAITTDKLAGTSVTSAKLATGAVTEGKIGSGAVTSGKIGSGAVTEAKIGSGAVTSAKIAEGAITAEKVAAGVIPGWYYYASTTAYNNDASNVPNGSYVLIGTNQIILYRKASGSLSQMCAWPTGGSGGNVDNVVIVPIENNKAQLTPYIIYNAGNSIMFYLLDTVTNALARLYRRPTSAAAENAEFIWEDTTNRQWVLYSLPASSSSNITKSYVAFDSGGGGGDGKPAGGWPLSDLANQGVANANKLLGVGGDGSVTLLPDSRILFMTQTVSTEGGVTVTAYSYQGANFAFQQLSDLQALVGSGVMLWLINSTTGSAYRAVNSRGTAAAARITFAGETMEGDNEHLRVEAFLMDGQMNITRTQLDAIGKLTVTIRSSSGHYVSDKSPAEILAAQQAGDVVEVVCSGVKGWITTCDSSGALALSISNDGAIKYLEMWNIDTDKSVALTTQTLGDAFVPSNVTLNGATPTISYAYNNTIYRGGTLTSLTVNNFVSNGMFELIFDSGATPTNLVLPVYDAQHPNAVYVEKGGFVVEANNHYEISIRVENGVGYLLGKGW